MSIGTAHRYPALHNAMWPGLVGKGPGSEPPIDLDTMLNLTAAARVDGVGFDGVDLFLSLPHTDIDSSDDDLQALAGKLASKNLKAGSLVAPVWGGTGGGSAMGDETQRTGFLTQVRKACRIGRRLRDLKIREYGVIRIDSATGVEEWAKDPEMNTRRIAQTFREACTIAEDYGERLAAEGEICWGSMHSWRRNVELLQIAGRPQTLGFQADMAHTMLFTMGFNAPEDSLLPEGFDWSQQDKLAEGVPQGGRRSSSWTIDLHIAQNDGTVKGSGCTTRPAGTASRSTRTANSTSCVTQAPGCATTAESRPGPSSTSVGMAACSRTGVLSGQQIWNEILSAMIAVRNVHGWD